MIILPDAKQHSLPADHSFPSGSVELGCSGLACHTSAVSLRFRLASEDTAGFCSLGMFHSAQQLALQQVLVDSDAVCTRQVLLSHQATFMLIHAAEENGNFDTLARSLSISTWQLRLRAQSRYC